MSVKIIIDSTADVSVAARERLIMVPLTVHFGEREFRDRIDLGDREFYEKLVESDILPTTSQATPAAFLDIFERELSDGTAAVVLTIAGKLSGTYASARMAAEEYPGQVFVVDSNTAAVGTGVLAEYALRLAEAGMDAREIAAELEAEKDKVCVIALLDTLEYLKRGGRISKTAAFAGGLLSIKPVICIRDGEIAVLGRARGSRQGNNLLNQEIAKAGGCDFGKPVLLGYTGLDDVLLQKYVEDSRAIWEKNITRPEAACIGSVIGTHVGPGAIAAAFFKAE